MEGSILNNLGFDPVYLIIAQSAITLILLVVVIVCIVKIKKLYRRYDYFMRGKDAESMEEMIIKQMEDIIDLKSQDRANKDSIVKYNAFKGMGGNLSFALALLDYTNTGFVINSVHSREGCYLYIKDVDRGQTDVALGNEEKMALEQALGYKEKSTSSQ